jgi:allantoicase
MQLSELNALPEDAAARELRRCCGSRRWARAMAAARPFDSVETLLATADRVWSRLDRADILEAFAAHPKIGETPPAGTASRSGDDSGWSAAEQAGVQIAGAELRDRLAARNRAYEARFGYIFIICASGLSADEMLAALEARVGHTPDEELPVAAEEQRRITRLRLAKLVDAHGTP